MIVQQEYTGILRFQKIFEIIHKSRNFFLLEISEVFANKDTDVRCDVSVRGFRVVLPDFGLFLLLWNRVLAINPIF